MVVGLIAKEKIRPLGPKSRQHKYPKFKPKKTKCGSFFY
jgi:hypothetical protein